MRLSSLALLASLALASRSALAQGSLSTQAFGYPAGGHSVRDAGAGGALGEFDPMSPNNAAALASWGSPGFYFQFSPEYRTVQSGGGTDKTTTIRFPLLAAAMPLGDRWVVGASATTFLDRTWQTQVSGVERFPTDTAAYTQTFGVDGAIEDYRFGAAFLVAPWLRVGVAGHVLAGSNRLSIERLFTDTLAFATFRQQSRISYSGGAFGAGIDVRPVRWSRWPDRCASAARSSRSPATPFSRRRRFPSTSPARSCSPEFPARTSACERRTTGGRASARSERRTSTRATRGT
jgi:hypothetical protein